VAEALGGLKKLIGTNAKLEVQGIPDLSVVKKIYDHTGNTAHLHDLRFSNLVQCVIEMEVTATGSFPQSDQGKPATWVLTYEDMASRAPVSISGYFSAPFTSDAAQVKMVPDAEAIVLQLQASDLDKELLRQIDEGKREEAIETKKKQVRMFEVSAQKSPHNQFVQVKLQAAQKSQQMMETEKDSRRVRKNCQQEGYLARKNSLSSIQQLQGYVVNDDDDEGDSRPSPTNRSPSPRSPSPTGRQQRVANSNQQPPAVPPSAAPAEPPATVAPGTRRFSSSSLFGSKK